MQHLPQDVLYEVFKLLVEEFPVICPLWASHCCQHWRKVALDAPTLWTRILIQCPKSQYVDRLAAWLERSGTSDLYIKIQSFDQSIDEFSCYVDRCLAILKHHTNRWKVLNIRTLKLTAESSQLLASCYLPELICLSVHVADVERLDLLRASSPKLSDLRIVGPIMLSELVVKNSALLPQSLKRLNIFHGFWPIGSTPLEIGLAITRKCPLLEELVVHLLWYLSELEEVSPNLLHPHSHEITVMPNLRRLDFSSTIDRRKFPILIRIQAPLLQRLEPSILFDHIPHILVQPDFPFPALQYVGIEAPIGSTDPLLGPVLTDFLHHLPDLRELTLTSFNFVGASSETYPFMRALGGICPKLHTLTLDRCMGGRLGKEVRGLIEARRVYDIQRIESLKIRKLPNPLLLSREQIEWFKANVKEFAIVSGESGT